MKSRPTVKQFLILSKNGVKRALSPLGQSLFNAYSENRDGKASSRRNILAENIFFNVIAAVTGGVFLTGLILIILENESETVKNQYLGLIISLQLLANTSQIFTPFLINKMKSYRAFSAACRATYFIINVVMLGIVPLLPFSATQNATIFLVLVVIMQVAAAIPNPAMGIWHIDNIPDSKRADWFSIQQISIPIFNTVSSVIASFVIDRFQLRGIELTGVLVIRGVLLLFVFLELRTHFKIKEPVYANTGKAPTFSSVFVSPFKCGPFLVTVLMVVLWNVVANLPGQYFNAYVLEDLQFSYTHINLCAATNIPLMMIAMPLWNKFVHKKGWLKALGTALGLYLLPYLFNCLMFKNTAWLYLVSVMYGNLILPGINLCFANLPYLKMPENNQTSCLAFYNASAGIASFIASYLGRSFILATENKVLRVFSMTIVNKQYICLISFAILLMLSAMILLVAHRDKKRALLAEMQAENAKSAAALPDMEPVLQEAQL